MDLETARRLDHLVGVGHGPVAPCLLVGIGCIDQTFGRPVGIGQNRLGQFAHRADIGGKGLCLNLLGGGTQDQPVILGRACHRLMGNLQKAVAFGLVADLA